MLGNPTRCFPVTVQDRSYLSRDRTTVLTTQRHIVDGPKSVTGGINLRRTTHTRPTVNLSPMPHPTNASTGQKLLCRAPEYVWVKLSVTGSDGLLSSKRDWGATLFFLGQSWAA